MEMTNQFSVAAPPDKAWAVLTDIERIAPCLPGAELKDVKGDEYHGVVKIKVGPITAFSGPDDVDATTRRAAPCCAPRAVTRAAGQRVPGDRTLEPQGDAARHRGTTFKSPQGAQSGRGVLAT